MCEEKAEFESARPDDAAARLKEVHERNLYWGLAYGKRPWWFETADGATGLVQIAGVSKTPPGLKIRYKLVQPSQGQKESGGDPTANPPVVVSTQGDKSIKLESNVLEAAKPKPSATSAIPPKPEPSSTAVALMQFRQVVDEPAADSEEMILVKNGKEAERKERFHVCKTVLLDQTAVKAATVGQTLSGIHKLRFY